jgi:hypothetical protein
VDLRRDRRRQHRARRPRDDPSHQDKTNVTGALTHAGVPRAAAQSVAGSITAGPPAPGSASAHPAALVHAVQLAFAHSTQTVFQVMAGVMAAAFVVSLLGLPRGRVEEVPETGA